MVDPGSTPTLLDGFLKDNYDTEEIARLVNEEHPFLDMLDTNYRGTGRGGSCRSSTETRRATPAP